MTAPSTLRTPSALARAGLVAPERVEALQRVAADYAVAITPAIAGLIDPSDPHDPIARQFVPDEAELDVRPEELADPIGDDPHTPVKGIVHRYTDRVLLKATHSCATYCRFCFRRETVGPGGAGALTPAERDAALAYIAAHDEIWEVILTGGDPLVLSPRRIRALMEGLNAIPHVKVVRFHTRVPVVAPAAVSAEMVAALKASDKAVYVALHANHPREMSADARAACARLVDAGIPMLSQTVLLAGVNDDPGVLAALMRAFVESRVKPYYLHHGDLVQGGSHFRTSIERGQGIVHTLWAEASGLCQPTYVLDTPGGHGKVPLAAGRVSATDAGFVLDTPLGGERPYPPR